MREIEGECVCEREECPIIYNVYIGLELHLLLNRYPFKDQGQRSRSEEEFITRGIYV